MAHSAVHEPAAVYDHGAARRKSRSHVVTEDAEAERKVARAEDGDDPHRNVAAHDRGRVAEIVTAHAEGVLVLVCGTFGNVIRLLPPLVIGTELLEDGLRVLTTAIEQHATARGTTEAAA